MPLDVEVLMTRYAKRGLADWSNITPYPVKLRASALLSGKIVENEWELQGVIKGQQAAGAKFIPMPRVNHGGIESCFFLPLRTSGDDNLSFNFELFLLVESEDENCLGFRFEQADVANQAHAYGHIQMNRKMLGDSFPNNGIPQWMPDSYPAFPICSSDSLQMFLSMATSIHGYGSKYDDGMRGILQNVFQGHPLDERLCLEKMSDFLK